MAKKIIDLNKIYPDVFYLDYTINERIEILNRLIEDKLYLEEKKSFFKKSNLEKYKNLFEDILYYELRNLIEHEKEDIKFKSDTSKNILEYNYYINILIGKALFFINETSTKDFIEDILDNYSNISLLKESINNLLNSALIFAKDTENTDLSDWVKKIQKPDNIPANILPFRGIKRLAASSTDNYILEIKNDTLELNIIFEKDNKNLLIKTDKLIYKTENKIEKIHISFKITNNEYSIDLLKNEYTEEEIFDTILQIENDFILSNITDLEISFSIQKTQFLTNTKEININPVTIQYFENKIKCIKIPLINNNWVLLDKICDNFPNMEFISSVRGDNTNKDLILDKLEININNTKIVFNFQLHINKPVKFDNISINVSSEKEKVFSLNVKSGIKFRCFYQEKETKEYDYNNFMGLEEFERRKIISLEIFCSNTKLEAKYPSQTRNEILNELNLEGKIIKIYNFEYQINNDEL